MEKRLQALVLLPLCFNIYSRNLYKSEIQNNQIVTVCGGGHEAHALAGMISNNGFKVNVLTRKPNDWSKNIVVNLPDKNFEATLEVVTNDASQIIPNSDVILVACPSFAFDDILHKIAPFVNKQTIVGALPGTGCFDYFCKKYLDPKITFFSSQRVPYICRIKKYGHEVNITGYVYEQMKYAVSNLDNKEFVLNKMEHVLKLKGTDLPNMLAVNLVNSNSLLHTSRLYALGAQRDYWEQIPLFYGDWNDLSSELLVAMDLELQLLFKSFPNVDFSCMETILEHYEVTNSKQLTKKIRSILSLKNILPQMIKEPHGYSLDYSSRYFTEDFVYKLGFIYLLCKIKCVKAPTIEKVALWGFEKLGVTLNDAQNLFGIKNEHNLIT
jgi:hypothetical protein